MSIRYSDDGSSWLNEDMWVSRDCRFVWNDKEWVWKRLPEDVTTYVTAKLTSMKHVEAGITCEVVDCEAMAVAVARNDRPGEYPFHACLVSFPW